MILPVLRYENSGLGPHEGPIRVQPRSPPASKRSANDYFHAGLSIILIRSDGREERRVARWSAAEERLALGARGDWPERPILMLPPPD
jgi:hypothetical protein